MIRGALVDISLPEGEVVENMNGGHDSFRLLMDRVRTTRLTGYLRASLALEGHDSSGVVFIEDGRPIYAIYSFRPTGNDSVEMVYRGEKAMEFVCGDSLYSNSKIELHKVADINELDNALRGREADKDSIKSLEGYFSSNAPEGDAPSQNAQEDDVDQLSDAILEFHVKNVREKTSPKKVLEIDVELTEGESYLVEETSRDYSHGIFAYLIDHGRMTGMGITRSNPRSLRARIEKGKPEILWLTDHETKTEDTISPSLEKIMVVVEEFLMKEEKNVVLIDDLQYLISSNNFDGAVRFIRSLVDKVSERNSIFLLSMDPASLNAQEKSIIEREMNVLKSK
ncbi:MAG: DUF835 domain-containing protein [Euryarchaeota archaeon]|nr:DUF835 domain-containing protein [Euryarchaeota archaeon]